MSEVGGERYPWPEVDELLALCVPRTCGLQRADDLEFAVPVHSPSPSLLHSVLAVASRTRERVWWLVQTPTLDLMRAMLDDTRDEYLRAMADFLRDANAPATEPRVFTLLLDEPDASMSSSRCNARTLGVGLVPGQFHLRVNCTA